MTYALPPSQVVKKFQFLTYILPDLRPSGKPEHFTLQDLPNRMRARRWNNQLSDCRIRVTLWKLPIFPCVLCLKQKTGISLKIRSRDIISVYQSLLSPSENNPGNTEVNIYNKLLHPYKLSDLLSAHKKDTVSSHTWKMPIHLGGGISNYLEQGGITRL